ncbi:MAG: hypothetical protein BWY31_01925 [Lentisphaerae bacterium ADurb.Bin242]|nr:MAG: hypothetical protein BWY31_01925 [Lentisphaerae bacterium ADurb.Bin242]
MKRNYTLIELLTVIGIIAILAGLIMPVIGLGIGRAKRAKCASNLKQVGSMITLFSTDRDGALPLYYKATAYTLRDKTIENATKSATGTYENITHADGMNADKRKLWTAGLLRHAQYNMSLFYCPSDEGRALDLFTKNANSSYSLNYGDADRPGGTDGSDTAVKITSATRSASGIILVGEAPQGRLGMDTTAETFFTSVNYDPHKKYYNFQYLDGHGEPVRIGDLKGLYTANAFKMKE